MIHKKKKTGMYNVKRINKYIGLYSNISQLFKTDMEIMTRIWFIYIQHIDVCLKSNR